MKYSKLAIASLAVAFVLWIFDFIVHGVILEPSYKATADAWRPEEEMMKWYPLTIPCYLLFAIGFTVIWALGFASKRGGVKSGALYGLLMGICGTSGVMMGFVYSPTPSLFFFPWLISGLLSGVLAGVVVNYAYKLPPRAPGNSDDRL